jgi:hypothetical protein
LPVISPTIGSPAVHEIEIPSFVSVLPAIPITDFEMDWENIEIGTNIEINNNFFKTIST